MKHAKILGTGSYLPAQRVTNEELARRVDTSDEWITTRTGIKARHIAAEHEKTSDLAHAAAIRALDDAGIAAGEIDLIIVATATPDMQFPAAATIVQQKLGVSGCPAFDVQAVCAGFVYAMATANAYIKSGMAKKALVIGADTFSRIMDWSDRRTCVLFGDGAGAVVLGASDEVGIIHSKLHADGNYLSLLNTPAQIADGAICGTPFLQMDGQGVFKFAVKQLAAVADEVLQEAGYTAEQIDWLVPHQANKRIIDATAKHLGLPEEKIILTVQEHANTSAASIPLALDAGIKDGRIRRGQVDTSSRPCGALAVRAWPRGVPRRRKASLPFAAALSAARHAGACRCLSADGARPARGDGACAAPRRHGGFSRAARRGRRLESHPFAWRAAAHRLCTHPARAPGVGVPRRGDECARRGAREGTV